MRIWGFSLDISRMAFAEDFFEKPPLHQCKKPLRTWPSWKPAQSRTPMSSGWSGITGSDPRTEPPRSQLKAEASGTRSRRSKSFASDVHAGRVAPPSAKCFTQSTRDRHRWIRAGSRCLFPTLCLIRSPTPWRSICLTTPTPTAWSACCSGLEGQAGRDPLCHHQQERRNAGDQERDAHGQAAFERAASCSPKHAVAVTMRGTRSWINRQMTGRLAAIGSPCGTGSAVEPAKQVAVGLLPAALQGLDIDALLNGAAACDQLPRGAQRYHAQPGRH
jgi:glucose-6-phosphate isomerase